MNLGGVNFWGSGWLGPGPPWAPLALLRGLQELRNKLALIKVLGHAGHVSHLLFGLVSTLEPPWTGIGGVS